MRYLFDSKGHHIANEVNGQLHAPRGKNIGHYMESAGIFIDMRGRYLGEIISSNRLVYDRRSPYRSTNYGSCGNYGNVGNYGNPGNYGAIGLPGGYRDVDADWL
jgi:hypothetical protein